MEEDEIVNLLLVAVPVMYMWLKLRRRRRKRRFWVRPILQLRDEHSVFQNQVQNMRAMEPDKYYNYHRMTIDQFDELLVRVKPYLQKMHVARVPIPPDLRLSLTLRYLATGDSMTSQHYNYLVGKSTISAIISETTKVIWDVLAPEVLKPPSANDWKYIAEEFYDRWDFPNCVGAIDGKHVVTQAFANQGSAFYNYKGSHSIVLMAACDAQYRFTFVSIGAAGRESDGGVFQNSSFGQAILNQTLPVPPPQSLPGSLPGSLPAVTLPHVFVADNAFPLKTNLMRPYSGPNLSHERIIFNYRLSRARRVIENTFGILASKWRIFRKPIIATVTTVERIVMATVALDNWLRSDDFLHGPGHQRYIQPGLADTEGRDGNVQPGAWREEGDPGGFQPLPRTELHNSPRGALQVQRQFTEYFMAEGAIQNQWWKLPFHVRQYYM